MQVETVLDLRYNIAALAIAILRDDVITSEDAFAILEGEKRRMKRNKKKTSLDGSPKRSTK